MMESSKGRPYCKSARMFLHEKDERRNAHPQCENCRFIIYIGCPTFESNFGFKKKDAENYIRWWYRNEDPHNVKEKVIE